MEWIKKNYEPLLGLGMMYVWGCAALGWIDWWNAKEFMLNAIAFGGTALVSLVMLGAFLHISSQEERIKALEEKIYNLNKIYNDSR